MDDTHQSYLVRRYRLRGQFQHCLRPVHCEEGLQNNKTTASDKEVAIVQSSDSDDSFRQPRHCLKLVSTSVD